MFQLIFRINEEDAFPIIVYPRQNRGLKESEVLVFEDSDPEEFEKRLKDVARNFIRLHGEVVKYNK